MSASELSPFCNSVEHYNDIAMKTRTRYDTLIPYLFSIGKEELVPEKIRRNIPDANKSKWRRMAPERISHSELRMNLGELVEKAELQKQLKYYRKALYGMTRAIIMLRPLVAETFLKQKNKMAFKTSVVQAVRQNEPFVPLRNTLRYMNIPRSTFFEWESDIIHQCDKSPVTKCVRRRPRQVSQRELRKMKTLLNAKRFAHWPVASICYYASREGILHLSLNTWYKYCRMMGIKRKLYSKAPKRTGIQATAPNQIWHMDVTSFRDVTGKQFYIYEVVDNFSRKILAWTISEKLSMHFTRKILEEAVLVSNQYHETMNIRLIVDGGSENFNTEITSFLKNNTFIQRLRALKDIAFSNSRIEAVHKILKSRYLRRKPLPGLPELTRTLRRAIRDYNEIRPHYSLKGFTPLEVYCKQQPNYNFTKYRNEAAGIRVQLHRCVNCECNNYGKCANKK